ncbi:MAG TPA: MarR family winged helix-turn-helix transcriptional regulator [Candidatus Polarisedimenticolaceae bacterium]|nr:MarR family winged helix-turn-helix transcriptional regulator [Candidatus Polarisedimenticolaceae bacterium]
MASAAAEDATGITRSEYERLAGFRHALRAFLRFSENAAAEAGLSARQHQALIAIKGFPGDGITIGALAESLQLRHHSVVGLVDRMAGKRLVIRRRGADDGRRVELVLTRRGEALLERLALSHRDELRRLAPQIELLLADLRPRKRGR